MANPYALDFNPLASAITDNQQMDLARNRLAMDQKRLGFEAERLGFERDLQPFRVESAKLGNVSAKQGITREEQSLPLDLAGKRASIAGQGLQNQSTAQSIEGKRMELEKELAGRIAGIAQMWEGKPEDQQKVMLDKLYGADKRFRGMVEKYIPKEVAGDPVVVGRTLRALAAGYQAPQTMKVGEGDAIVGVSRDPNNPAAPAKIGEIYRNPKGKEPPTGYEIDPTKPGTGALRPVPGGPADKITGEQAARTALIVGGVQNMPKIRSIFIGTPGTETQPGQPGALGSNMSPLSYARHYSGVGDVGEGQRLMASAMEGVLRALTGAAATKDEVAREVTKYLPGPADTMETRQRKLDLFEGNLRKIAELTAHGTSGSDILASMRSGSLDNMKTQGRVQQQRAPISVDAIRALQSDPNLASQFDAKYGTGASKQFLTPR